MYQDVRQQCTRGHFKTQNPGCIVCCGCAGCMRVESAASDSVRRRFHAHYQRDARLLLSVTEFR